MLAEFVLARSSAGIADASIHNDVAAVVQLREWFGRPLWELAPADADRYFGRHLRDAAPATKLHKATSAAVYYEFLEVRHKPAIHAATGFVVECPLDEINRPRGGGQLRLRIRRLATDCLDAYPDGHPRLRIPVGKGHAERMIPLHPQAADALLPLIELARQQQARPRVDPSAGRPVHHIFLVRGKLLSNAFLFELSLKAACTAAGLVDPAGKPTITAHRFRHTIGTQLAEGGARIQTIMAVLGHRTPNMSIIYASLSDPTVKRQYQDALDRHLGPDVTLAGPAAAALREHRLDAEAVSWLQTNFLKTELELGHCLRTPAEGPCECDLALSCSKFLTTSEYAPRLRARMDIEDQLIADATTRGWDREVERHRATRARIEQLLTELGSPPPGTEDLCTLSALDAGVEAGP